MTLIPLTKELVNKYISDMIKMSQQIPNDYWKLENYLIELNKKWELSYAVLDEDKMIAFMLVSDKGENHHLHRIVVDTAHKGNGIGTELLNKLKVNASLGAKNSVTLKVNPLNEDARKLYKKMGFIESGMDGENIVAQVNLTK